MGDPRGTYRWQKLRAQVRATHPPICAECGRDIDMDAPPRSKWAPSVDHPRAIRDGGAHFPSLDELRLVHQGCNARKGAKAQRRRRRPVLRTSREW